jgi:hypothetical protein
LIARIERPRSWGSAQQPRVTVVGAQLESGVCLAIKTGDDRKIRHGFIFPLGEAPVESLSADLRGHEPTRGREPSVSLRTLIAAVRLSGSPDHNGRCIVGPRHSKASRTRWTKCCAVPTDWGLTSTSPKEPSASVPPRRLSFSESTTRTPPSGACISSLLRGFSVGAVTLCRFGPRRRFVILV